MLEVSVVEGASTKTDSAHAIAETGACIPESVDVTGSVEAIVVG